MKILIIYYSRTGNTKRIAQELATLLPADIEKIIESEPREGFINWLRAGKDAMQKKISIIAPIKSNIGEYDLLIIGSPVWAFTVPPPIRSFLTQYRSEIKRVAFFATMGGRGDKRAFLHMQEICAKMPLLTETFLEKEIKQNFYQSKLHSFIEGIKQKIFE